MKRKKEYFILFYFNTQIYFKDHFLFNIYIYKFHIKWNVMCDGKEDTYEEKVQINKIIIIGKKK